MTAQIIPLELYRLAREAQEENERLKQNERIAEGMIEEYLWIKQFYSEDR